MRTTAGQQKATSLSVIIRYFNEERHLPVLLEAIQRQTIYPNEVVVVDSGSTDSTVQIALRKGAIFSLNDLRTWLSVAKAAAKKGWSSLGTWPGCSARRVLFESSETTEVWQR